METHEHQTSGKVKSMEELLSISDEEEESPHTPICQSPRASTPDAVSLTRGLNTGREKSLPHKAGSGVFSSPIATSTSHQSTPPTSVSEEGTDQSTDDTDDTAGFFSSDNDADGDEDNEFSGEDESGNESEDENEYESDEMPASIQSWPLIVSSSESEFEWGPLPGRLGLEDHGLSAGVSTRLTIAQVIGPPQTQNRAQVILPIALPAPHLHLDIVSDDIFKMNEEMGVDPNSSASDPGRSNLTSYDHITIKDKLGTFSQDPWTSSMDKPLAHVAEDFFNLDVPSSPPVGCCDFYSGEPSPPSSEQSLPRRLSSPTLPSKESGSPVIEGPPPLKRQRTMLFDPPPAAHQQQNQQLKQQHQLQQQPEQKTAPHPLRSYRTQQVGCIRYKSSFPPASSAPQVAQPQQAYIDDVCVGPLQTHYCGTDALASNCAGGLVLPSGLANLGEHAWGQNDFSHPVQVPSQPIQGPAKVSGKPFQLPKELVFSDDSFISDGPLNQSPALNRRGGRPVPPDATDPRWNLWNVGNLEIRCTSSGVGVKHLKEVLFRDDGNTGSRRSKWTHDRLSAEVMARRALQVENNKVVGRPEGFLAHQGWWFYIDP